MHPMEYLTGMKLVAIIKWIFYPFVAVGLGITFAEYPNWFEQHWENLVGGTVGTAIAGTDTVATLQSMNITYDFKHDMYLIFIAVLRACAIVFFSLLVTYFFKKKVEKKEL